MIRVPGRSSRPSPDPRDQRESAFAPILSDLVVRVPGACAAALVDRGGETVDYGGRLSPFDVRLAAATWQLVLSSAQVPSLPSTKSLVIQAARASYIAHPLPEGYALVVVLLRRAGFRGWARAVPASAWRLANEAGWSNPPAVPWYAVEARLSDRGHPCSLRVPGCGSMESTIEFEVIGAVRSITTARERAWRIRLGSGLETTLVRESGGFWYADEPPNASQRPGPKKRL